MVEKSLLEKLTEPSARQAARGSSAAHVQASAPNFAAPASLVLSIDDQDTDDDMLYVPGNTFTCPGVEADAELNVEARLFAARKEVQETTALLRRQVRRAANYSDRRGCRRSTLYICQLATEQTRSRLCIFWLFTTYALS
jgi:hypothetical protein